MLMLKKNESATLAKENGTPVLKMSVGVNWGMINKTGSSKASSFLSKLASAVGASDAVMEAVDLDLSMIFVDDKGQHMETCYFGNKRCFNSAIVHTGDDRTGDSDQNDQDNEIIKFDGLKMPANFKTAFVVLNSYTHQKFDQIPYIGINFYDGLVNLSDKGLRFAEFSMTNDKMFAGKECCILAKITRTLKGYDCEVLGECTADRTLRDLERTCITKHL